MMKPTFLTLALALSAMIALSACQNTQLQHSPTKTAQTHATNPATHSAWSYAGDNGPEYWGDIHGNALCKTGSEQSPINIAQTIITSDLAPQPKFGVSDVEVENNGHTIVFTPSNDANHTTIHGDTFSLVQFHYHVPSEHQIVGVNYPAELHFVHANKQGELAVIGVMLDPTTQHDTSLTQLLMGATDSGVATLVKGVDLRTLLPSASGFYHYPGSLTTPPCSEHVNWYVAQDALPVTASEIAIMKELYEGNNRPIQPLGARQVRQIQ